MWQLLLLLSLSHGMESENCRDMNCDSVTRNSDCVVVSTSYINLYKCTEGYKCPTAILNNTASMVDTTCEVLVRNFTCTGAFDLTPGRKCCTGNDCKSGICANNVCTTISPCSVDEDCIRSKYCSGSSCVDCKSEGDSCSRDAECSISYGCNLGICTQVLSLPIGSPASDSKFCQTGFYYNNTCEGVDVSVNRTAQVSPFECRIKDVCNYTYTYAKNIIELQPCLCSGKSGMVGYCSAYVAYDPLYAAAMYANLDYTSSNCGGIYVSSVDPEILLECGSIGKANYYAFIKDLFRAYYWNIYNSGILENCAMLLDLYDPNASSGKLLILSIIGLITF